MSTTTATTIRVVRVTKIGSVDPGVASEQVLWEGADTDDLSRQFPPSEVFGADPLGHAEIEDGHIRIGYRFEQFMDGLWQKIDDPRRRHTPLSEFERAVDTENRRDFPGDFLDVCQSCGHSPCECYEDEVDDWKPPWSYCEGCGAEVEYKDPLHDARRCINCGCCAEECQCWPEDQVLIEHL